MKKSVKSSRAPSSKKVVAKAPLPAPARGVKIVVTPRGTGLSGLFNDRIIVTTTSPRQPKVVIPVMGSL